MTEFAHVTEPRMRAYLEGTPGGFYTAEALAHSADCLEADIRADESGMECAPPIEVLSARETAYETARHALTDRDTLEWLQAMWRV